MKIRTWHGACKVAAGAMILLAGCQPSQQPKLSVRTQDAAALAAELSQVAVSVLGNQAEVVAHGDLARNGKEQLLIMNRLQPTSPPPSSPLPKRKPEIHITQAAILEKDGAKWTEVLHGDEHLKNPNGYLVRGQATTWNFEFNLDGQRGLELRFTSADRFDVGDAHTGRKLEAGMPTFVVRWNDKVKRYQSFDSTEAKFLSEIPMLETPQSILR
jgi:hypothetical protein